MLGEERERGKKREKRRRKEEKLIFYDFVPPMYIYIFERLRLS